MIGDEPSSILRANSTDFGEMLSTRRPVMEWLVANVLWRPARSGWLRIHVARVVPAAVTIQSRMTPSNDPVDVLVTMTWRM